MREVGDMIRSMWIKWSGLGETRYERLMTDLGLLVLRVGLAALLIGLHGWGKLAAYGDKAGSFPDPLGVGGPVSMALAVFAEFFCAIAVMLGLATRLALIPLVIMFVVAAALVHGGDPLQAREPALLYLIPFVVLFLTGPGRFSVDGCLVKR